MLDNNYFRLQFIIYARVSASFTNIDITQPELPVLQSEFSANAVVVSFSVSAVILGIAIANLPFGVLSDRIPIHPIGFTTERITLLYGVYVAGIFVEPAAGKISKRFGSGITLNRGKCPF